MNFTKRICSIMVWRPSLIQRPWKRTSGPTNCTITSGAHRHHRKRLRTSRLINNLLALSHPLGGPNILTWTPTTLIHLINLWGLRQACNRSVDLRIFQGQGEAGFHKRRNQDRGAT